MDGKGLLEVFLASFPKGPGCLPYVFLIAGYVVALVTVDDPTLLIHGVLVLRLHKYLFDSCVSLEVYLDAILTTDVLETFSCALNIWNNYLTYCVDWSGVVQTVLALWVSVTMTLYLAARLWWLSHCKYWSVCVWVFNTLLWIGNCLLAVLLRYQGKELPHFLSTFHCKLNCWIYTIDMIQKFLFTGLLLNDPCVIHEPVPYLGGLQLT